MLMSFNKNKKPTKKSQNQTKTKANNLNTIQYLYLIFHSDLKLPGENNPVRTDTTALDFSTCSLIYPILWGNIQIYYTCYLHIHMYHTPGPVIKAFEKV